MKLVSCFFGLALAQNDVFQTYLTSQLLGEQGGDFAKYAILTGGTNTPFGRAAISNELFDGGIQGAVLTDQFFGGSRGGYGYGYPQRQQSPDLLSTYALSGLIGDDFSSSSALPLLALGGGFGGGQNQLGTAVLANSLGGGFEGAYLATQLGQNNNNYQQPYRPYRPAPVAAWSQPAYAQTSAYVQPASYVQPTYVQQTAYASVYPSRPLYPTTFQTTYPAAAIAAPAWSAAPYAVATTVPTVPAWSAAPYATVATTLPSWSSATLPTWNAAPYAAVATTPAWDSYTPLPAWNSGYAAVATPAVATTLPASWNPAPYTVGVAAPYATVGVAAAAPLAPVWNPPSTLGVGVTLGR